MKQFVHQEGCDGGHLYTLPREIVLQQFGELLGGDAVTAIESMVIIDDTFAFGLDE